MLNDKSEAKPVEGEVNSSIPSNNLEKDTTEKCDPSFDTRLNEILDHLKESPAVFQSQQIGEPELSASDKRKIAEDLFHRNREHFLLKFGLYLKEDHIALFSGLKGNTEETEYYINQVRLSIQASGRKSMTRNRRYEALQRLEAEGSYFSETEMEKREPLLYHQLVGQFLSEKEKLKIQQDLLRKDNSIPTFSKFLIDKMEQDYIDDFKKSQEEAEDEQNTYVDSSDEDIVDESQPVQKHWGDDWTDVKIQKQQRAKIKKKNKKKKVTLSTQEKALLHNEFKSLMQSKFLNGMDTEFDYSTVDMNPEYDCLQVRSQDEEEKYFDEETCNNDICTDTGIEDY